MKTKIVLYIFSFISVFSLSGCLYTLSPFGWCSDWEIYYDGKETQNKSNNFTMNVCSDELGYRFRDPLLNFKKNENLNIANDRLTTLLHSQKNLRKCEIDKQSIRYLAVSGGSPITATVICTEEIIFTKKFGPTYRSNLDYPVYMHMLSFPFPK